MQDLISRQAAIDTLNVGAELLKRVLDDADIVGAERAKYEWGLGLIESYISDMKELPSAQPVAKDINVPVNDLISRQAAIDYCYQLINVEYEQGSDEMNYGQERVNQTETILHHLEIMPSAQPETHDKRMETHSCDLIDRQAAIDALKEHRALFCDNTPDTFSKLSYAEKSRVDELDMAIATLINLPSAQPDSKELSFTQKKLDTISRQAAISVIAKWMLEYGGEGEERERNALKQAAEEIKDLPSAQPKQTNSCYTNSWCIGCKEYDHERKCCPRYNRVIRQTLDEAYAHGETEAEYRFYKTEKRCDTCRHEKSQWFNRCADCFEYELWEEKT